MRKLLRLGMLYLFIFFAISFLDVGLNMFAKIIRTQIHLRVNGRS